MELGLSVRYTVDVPHSTLNAMNVLSLSMLIQQNDRIPLANAQRPHVTIAPRYWARNPLNKRPKKLPATLMTNIYKAKLSLVPSLSIAYVGM
jgi:hypothetical protein